MKKILSMMLVVCLSAGALVGCGGKPADIDQEVYDLGVEVCDVLEDYVQGKMEWETCNEKMEELESQAQELEEKYEEEYGDKYPIEEHFDDHMVLEDITIAKFSISLVEEGETYEAEDALNDLKEELNLN